MNITVHSNGITQVTLYKHTESAFTWLINVGRDCKVINQHLRFLGDSRISVLLQCFFFFSFLPQDYGIDLPNIFVFSLAVWQDFS